jgi:hypothetical protein
MEEKMQKIPTIFKRDWAGDRSRVLNAVNPDCEWVFAGEGVTTRKLDGTCCMIRDGKLYKRRELRRGDKVPMLFEQVGFDPDTGKSVGWVPCDIGLGDKWHMAAFYKQSEWPNGTYELVGPKVQGNHEHWLSHDLIAHGSITEDDVPRTFDELREWLANKDIEGIVFHHPDGRMAKIKLRDFGLSRMSLVMKM